MGKANIIEIGFNRHLGKKFFLLSLKSASEWPDRILLPSEHFGLLLAWDARTATNQQILSLARRTFEQGLAYLCAWGDDCERVHDQFDEEGAAFALEAGTKGPGVVITTWHEDESLEETMWFFANAAWPDGHFIATCHSWVVAVIGNETRVSDVRKRLAAQVTHVSA